MIIKHLLPNARAWRITVDKQLREFFVGLSGIEVDVKAFFDGVWDDIFPDTTREIEAWENQFGLVSGGLSEQERRDRLDAAWKAVGGQSPRYIEDTLQANGFDVYVHEPWIPGTEPAVDVHGSPTYYSPIVWLRSDTSDLYPGVDCGEVASKTDCGEAFAECGNSVEPPGFALVNKIEGVTYTVPADTTKWPFFIYIGGAVFGDMVTVDTSRRDEFEALCLKICPTHDWLGMFVQYS